MSNLRFSTVINDASRAGVTIPDSITEARKNLGLLRVELDKRTKSNNPADEIAACMLEEATTGKPSKNIRVALDALTLRNPEVRAAFEQRLLHLEHDAIAACKDDIIGQMSAAAEVSYAAIRTIVDKAPGFTTKAVATEVLASGVGSEWHAATLAVDRLQYLGNLWTALSVTRGALDARLLHHPAIDVHELGCGGNPWDAHRAGAELSWCGNKEGYAARLQELDQLEERKRAEQQARNRGTAPRIR
ncbi:hypothetical protein [Smaragdicoccus niigatensis]|uniref:hypothetical protein n=1 Tax=Smaragdicoccus niigatensis TaxID=359359 RepID=UPI000373CE2F|nr:hypothetical protein [Smaragdicoccus niigatensis]